MDLKRLSLGKETKNNTITTHNKEPVRNKRKISHTLEPPTLRLDADYGATLYLKLYKDPNNALCFEANLKYREDGSSNRTEHLGYSANILPELDETLKIMSNKLSDISLRFYFSLIILGRIYEAICKSGLSMDGIEFDKHVLNNFVNKSLAFYDYYDYEFSCYLAMNILHKYTKSCADFILDSLYESNREFTIGDQKGVLGYTKTYVYLRMDMDNVIILTIALDDDLRDTMKETSNPIKEVMAWILLTSKGYYVHNQKFVNPSFSSAENLSDAMHREIEITPDNFAQCFKQS